MLSSRYEGKPSDVLEISAFVIDDVIGVEWRTRDDFITTAELGDGLAVRLIGGVVLSGTLDSVTAKTLFLSNVCVSFATIMSVEECEV